MGKSMVCPCLSILHTFPSTSLVMRFVDGWWKHSACCNLQQVGVTLYSEANIENLKQYRPKIVLCYSQCLSMPRGVYFLCHIANPGSWGHQCPKCLGPVNDVRAGGFRAEANARALLLLAMQCYHIVSRLHHAHLLPKRTYPLAKHDYM